MFLNLSQDIPGCPQDVPGCPRKANIFDLALGALPEQPA